MFSLFIFACSFQSTHISMCCLRTLSSDAVSPPSTSTTYPLESRLGQTMSPLKRSAAFLICGQLDSVTAALGCRAGHGRHILNAREHLLLV